MSGTGTSSRLTPRERLTATLLRLAPWLAFLLSALPAPLYFLLRYFTTTVPEDVAVYMLLTLASLGVGVVVGLVAAFLFVLYRRRWEKRLREKLARDGVTAGELKWFASELKPDERRALKAMESQNLLLADAYRETLAARITASRVLDRTRRETEMVAARLERATQLQGSSRASLEKDLLADRERLARVTREAEEHHAEIETRLQTIEALASRGASEAETEQALLRLGTARQFEPLSLTSAQAEFQTREEVRQELREINRPQQG